MKRGPLSEVEKVKILTNIAEYHAPKSKFIGEKLNRSPETVKKFHYQYKIAEQLIDTLVQEGIIGSVKAYPQQTLEEISDDFDISRSKAKGILNSNKIQYFQQTPIVGLDEQHKNARVNFCSKFSHLPYFKLPRIIFTDESTVHVDEKNGGICKSGI